MMYMLVYTPPDIGVLFRNLAVYGKLVNTGEIREKQNQILMKHRNIQFIKNMAIHYSKYVI